jgi:chromosome partition protein MukB
MRLWSQIFLWFVNMLEGLEDCPEDLYLIEGDPQSFDDSVFAAEEQEQSCGWSKHPIANGVILAYPEVPLFGRAARESRLGNAVCASVMTLAERYATLSFDVQKDSASRIRPLVVLSAAHLAVAFDARSGS